VSIGALKLHDKAAAPDRTRVEGRRVPKRSELDGATKWVLRSGRRKKADLFVVDLGEGPMLVKDFASKPPLYRFLGRIQTSREVRSYRRLRGESCVPALVGRIDRHAFAVEEVPGELLVYAPSRFREADRYLARLEQRVARLHELGIAHMDLRSRDNVLLRPDGEIVLVDLAGAVHVRPGSILHRLLFPLLTLPDRAALLKWKWMLAPDRLTEDERARFDRFQIARRLWPFNRKYVKAMRAGQPLSARRPSPRD
jgi:hypothetical protein